MPSTGKSKVTDSQRRKIAAGKVSGKTAKQLAAETGLAQSTVEKASTDPRTAALILELKSADEASLRRMWSRSLETIEDHLESDDPAVVREARRDALKFITAGDPAPVRIDAPQKDSAKATCTLEELLTTFREATSGV